MTWTDFALCRDLDPELFFPVSVEGTPRGNKDRARAKAVCADCPVRSQCLSFALANEDPERVFGIFGGLSESERQGLHRAGKVAGCPLVLMIIHHREGAPLSRGKVWRTKRNLNGFEPCVTRVAVPVN